MLQGCDPKHKHHILWTVPQKRLPSSISNSWYILPLQFYVALIHSTSHWPQQSWFILLFYLSFYTSLIVSAFLGGGGVHNLYSFYLYNFGVAGTMKGKCFFFQFLYKWMYDFFKKMFLFTGKKRIVISSTISYI